MPVEKLGEPAWLPHLVPNLKLHLEYRATKPRKNKTAAKVETERESRKPVLKTTFYLNRSTSHRATKT